MNAARRSYFVLIALLCYAILFSQMAHAAKLPRKNSIDQLPQQIKLVVAQPIPPRDTLLSASSSATLDFQTALFLFTGLLVGFGLRRFLLAPIGLCQRSLQRSAGWLQLGPQFRRFDLRV